MSSLSATEVNTLSSSTNKRRDHLLPSCLCCQFLDNKNFFLPKTLYKTSNKFSSINNNKTGSSINEIATTNTESKHEDDLNTIVVALDGLQIDPYSVWQEHTFLNNRNITNDADVVHFVDTHTHAHLERQQDASSVNDGHMYAFPNTSTSTRPTINDDIKERLCSDTGIFDSNGNNGTVMIVCAVDQSDWDTCLHYASLSKYRIPALGIHPWYVESTATMIETSSSNADDPMNNYSKDGWIQKLESVLQQHPKCMVGEIGLCKVARFIRTYEQGKQAALLLQRTIFVQQVRLAAKYNRPISVHCVNQHGVLYDIFTNLNDEENEIPPAIALHSYTGTVHHIQNLLKWEESIVQERQKRLRRDSSNKLDEIPPQQQPLLYFGFSHSVNYVMCTSSKSKRQMIEVLQYLPRNRIVIESDVHDTNHVVLGTMSTIIFMAHILDVSIPYMIQLSTENGLRFISSLDRGE